MRILLLLSLITLLTACATAGRPINFNQVAVIREGITTQQEVIDLFGSPDRVTSDDQGNVTFIYGRAGSSVPEGTDGKDPFVMITLKDDHVKRVISSQSAKAVKPN